MVKKTVIFDFDGTLVQTLPHILEIINRIGKNYSSKFKRISFSDIEKYRDKGVREIFKELNISILRLPFLAKKIRSELAKDIGVIKPVEGIAKILVSLKKEGYLLGLLTSNAKENVMKFLRKNQMAIFDFVESENNIFGKDRALKKIVRKYLLDSNNVIYVGDEIRDIEACYKVGLPIIAVSWGFNSKSGLLRHKPTFLVERAEELTKILEGEIK